MRVRNPAVAVSTRIEPKIDAAIRNASSPDGSQQAWFGAVSEIIGNQALAGTGWPERGRDSHTHGMPTFTVYLRLRSTRSAAAAIRSA